MRETLVADELEGYDPVVGAALWRLEDARERTLRVVGELSPDSVDAETGRNSIGTILYHVALIEADWLFSEILEREPSPQAASLLPYDDRDEAGILTLVRGQTLDEHLDRLRAIRAIVLRDLKGMTAADFQRPRNLPQYDVSPAWVLHHLAQHEAEHRGELGSIVARLQSPS